jgi:aminopeptidase N
MAAAEITRAETARRARLVRVRSYEVALDFTTGAQKFGSVATIRFDCAEPGAATYVDLVAATVREVVLNGTALDPAAVCADGRVTLPDLAASNELVIRADCAYTHSGTGMHRSADSADGRVYVYGKFTPAHARYAYACFEQPDMKAPFTFTVTVPAGWAVLSNQNPATERSAGDSKTVRFPPTPPLPTFCTTVVAGDYHVVTSSHTTRDGREIPLVLACRASLAAYLDAAAIFGLTGQGLDFYEELLGCPYPYAKYGHAFVPEFSAGATEDPGCVLVSEMFLSRGKVTAALAELRTMVILHEMAHMWFGDLVTARWWDDLWLSESFAEFCGHDACVRLGLYPEAWSTFSVSRKAWGFAQDRLPSTHPVAADAATLSAAMANFDGISYAKGASVLRQLTGYVGEENFFAGIRDYIAAHAYGSARLPDLLSAIGAHTGKDLAAWSKAWLETAGVNTLRCEFGTGAAGELTSFAITQEAPPGHPVLRPHRVSIGLYERDERGVSRVRSAEAEVAGARTRVPALDGTPQPDLILVNDDDREYVLARFDPRSLRTVTAAVGELADPLARAACWNALLDMVSQAELAVPDFAAALAAGVRLEPSVARAQALLAQARPVIEQLAGPADAVAAKERLACVAATMLGAAEPGGDHQLAWAQLLSWTAVSGAQLDLVAGLLDGGVDVPGLPVDTELRWSLLRRLAAMERAGDAAIDAELTRDQTEAGRRHATACRAAIPSAAHKEAGWSLLASGTLGPESVRLTARAFMLPEHAALLAPYAAAYLPTLAAVWDRHGEHLRALLGELLFPYPVVSADLLAALDEFAAARPADPGLARLLAELRDTGSRALRSRELRLGGLAEPGAGRDRQGLDAGGERRLDDRGEFGRVVGRQFVEAALAERRDHRVGVEAAPEPVDRRHSRRRPEHPHVLAGRDRRQRQQPVRAEVGGERGHGRRRRLRIADQQRGVAAPGHRGRAGRAGHGGLAAHDPLDSIHDQRPGVRRVSPHANAQLRRVGNDVRLRARVQPADGDHGGLGRRDLPGDDPLQPGHDVRGHQHRVDGGLRARAVAAAAVERDLRGVGGGHDRPAAVPDPAGGHRPDVLAEHDLRRGEALEKPVVDHFPGAAAFLLGGLEHGEQRSRPGRRLAREDRRRADQARDVHVVPARVSHRHVPSAGVPPADGARVRQAGLLLDGQRVHVGAQHHRRPGAVAEHADDAGAPDVLGDLETERPQGRRHESGGPPLLPREFRVRVQVLVEAGEPRAELVEPGPESVGHEIHLYALAAKSSCYGVIRRSRWRGG